MMHHTVNRADGSSNTHSNPCPALWLRSVVVMSPTMPKFINIMVDIAGAWRCIFILGRDDPISKLSLDIRILSDV
jgi:hypothetical protein